MQPNSKSCDIGWFSQSHCIPVVGSHIADRAGAKLFQNTLDSLSLPIPIILTEHLKDYLADSNKNYVC